MVERLIFLILILVAGYAQGITALDDDFFGENSSLNPNSDGLSVLNPDFFKDASRSLKRASGGNYACTSVVRKSPSGESQAISAVAQRFCSGAPSVQWVPNVKAWRGVPPSYNRDTTPAGYFQICCFRKYDVRGRPMAR